MSTSMEAPDHVSKKAYIEEEEKNGEFFVKVRNLPRFSELNEKAKKTVDHLPWIDLYGLTWSHILLAAGCHVAGFFLLRSTHPVAVLTAVVLISAAHAVHANRASHLAIHGTLCRSPGANAAWGYFFNDFIGSFSSAITYDIHIREHHPYTNVIGRGDSSSWKVSILPRTVYMFFAPLLFPAAAPLFAMKELIVARRFKELFYSGSLIAAGLALNVFLLYQISGFTTSVWVTLAFIFTCRAPFAIMFVHVNIFQHIGLPMYSPASVPPNRPFLMSSSVLNLTKNVLFDFIFGATLTDCHIEHHLFPRLPDAACARIQPLVRKFLTEHGLPYHERTYVDRFGHFLKHYNQLMVKAPPVTHFIGLQ